MLSMSDVYVKGDMKKSDYDGDENGVVDNSEKLDGSSKAQVQDHTPKSHTHVESDVTDLDHDAQKVKGVDVDDTAKADQKVLTFVSASGKIEYITQAPSGATIKSIQHFYEAFTGAETQIDITIDEVDTSKTIIVFTDGKVHASGRNNSVSIRLINSTTVRLCKFLAAGTPTVAFSVVEYLSGVNLIQRGYTVLSGLDDIEDITITEVDLSKSFALHLGLVSSTSTAGISGWVRLLNSTTLRCESDYGDPTVSWEVIEFS